MGSKLLTISFLVVLMAVLVLLPVSIGKENEPELKQVNVVFRHGDRAPDVAEVYPNDPYLNYTFYPMGRGGMTNEGKRREYQLGQELKSRYGDFLGSIYQASDIEARSTDYDRTKMSLQLVLSGLYPPAPLQDWNKDLPWQPIPTTYRRSSEDILLEPELCPKYIAELDRVRKSIEVQGKVSKLNGLKEFLETHAGMPIRSTLEMYNLYLTFTAQRATNLTLPNWVNEVYPYGELFDGTILEYEVISYNEDLKRLNGGMLVRKISEAMAAHKSGTLPGGRKMYLYSGHETNIAALLNALGVYEPHVPQYSSAVMVELWKLNDQYFVKVLHYLGIPPTISTKRIPGCDELCPLDTFLELMRPVTPLDSDLICVKKSSTTPEVASNAVSDLLRNKIPL